MSVLENDWLLSIQTIAGQFQEAAHTQLIGSTFNVVTHIVAISAA